MNELLESDLREFYTAYDESYDAAQAIERLRANAPRARRHRTRLWAMVGASGAALAGGIAMAVLILSSGASVAYAGWTPLPTTPTPTALAAAVAQCKQAAAHVLGPALRSTVAHSAAHNCVGTPVLTDARGKYVALIYAEKGTVNEYITANNGGGSGTEGPIPAAPGLEQLSSPNLAGATTPESATERAQKGQREITRLKELAAELHGFNGSPSELVLHKFHFSGLAEQVRGDTDNEAIAAVERRIDSMAQRSPAPRTTQPASADPFGDAYGRAGSDISGVTFNFANGKSVTATVEDGWYFAWWPWTGVPTSAQVMTRSGTITSPLPGPQCSKQPSSCVFAGQPQD